MGCRRFKGEAFYDDLTGETHLPEELEELVFAFDGEALAIHLDDDNAAAFRAAMAPFVSAARPTSKSKVLGTLPRRKRHLTVVPDPPPEQSERPLIADQERLAMDRLCDHGQNEPDESGQNAPETEKGESAGALSEAKGLLVPESPSKPLDFSSPVEPRPALSLAPPAPVTPIPAPWGEFAPDGNDDKRSRIFKTRKWATEMGYPLNETLTPEMFTKWEEWYRDERWRNLE